MTDENADIWRMIEIHDLVEERKLAPTIDRDAWIKVSRIIFAPGERQSCHVCGKFKGIAEAHHVVPVSAQYDRGFKLPDSEFVWLCPNHHAIIHLYISGGHLMSPRTTRSNSGRSISLAPDVTEEEFGKLLDLGRRSFRGPT